MTDPIADMLTRIRNAYAQGAAEARIPFSRLKAQIADILSQEGYLSGVEIKGRLPRRTLVVALRYINQRPTIEGIKRISRPGQRIYRNARQLRPTRYGFGITILSTAKGLMTERAARDARLGGEVLCEVW
ncbi:MAG: 30S ribosomal protein S8 [Candidatus Terrybacteria bacterium RIFCSPHIGHO2_01_FULL_48_17]|uniref:Small ribosomal subunit protein uS8 n=1 Tax=Candidatus Terrybacteria bacterium RIFCSPHIGHO2_01_FULL_48_17 TaxID=1802362 RepID=A0A1G2PKQ5_9BACT|nr:MAG: 30S ribosomal protein S8 [Candidatus Terrybacteria bacterium RIFCSPHIGHO2_01_FULL_48_17]OHA52832.1 MAG: 30S ribosomal protein S8 [Candidatus Terrybacteria bacterium RIFCSPLOWO2_01_FULL_48_14]